jgi:hypothetical protein
MRGLLKLGIGDGRGFACLTQEIITLVPKKMDAAEVGDFRPISLVHSFSKLFSKILANQLRRRLMRFNPGNAHVCGLSRHGALVGSGKLDGDQTKAKEHKVLPRFGPLGRIMTYVLLV